MKVLLQRKHCLFTIMFALLLSFQASAQNVNVSGNVTATDGSPLVGATVIVKGTTTGTITNFNGDYDLSVNGNGTLVFSMMGYLAQEIEVQGQTQINVVLEEDTKGIDEVVVIGYGVQKKKLVTGSSVQVTGDDLAFKNTVDAYGALQNMAPGVQVVQNSGQPGEGYKINVRGLGTTGNSDPLIVIDGVAGGNLNDISPTDIESIDVLKDAASCAIYGARAANGVILVTTKKGNNSGKYKVTYDGYVGFQYANLNDVETLGAKDYMTIVNGTRQASGASLYDYEKLFNSDLYNAYMNGSNPGTNWLEESLNDGAMIQSHSLNILGGSDVNKISIGASYLTQEGTIGKQALPEYKRYTIRINSEHTLWAKNGRNIIKIGENAIFSGTEKTGVNMGGIYNNNIRNLLTATPLLPLYNSEGDYFVYKDMVDTNWDFETSVVNPIAQMAYQHGEKITETHRLQSSAFVEIAPIKQLKIKGNVGYQFGQRAYRSFVPDYELSVNNSNPTNDIENEKSDSQRYTIDYTINYVESFGNHNVDFLVGQSYEKWGLGSSLKAKNSNSEFTTVDGAYIANVPTVTTENTSIGGTPDANGSIASYFGRVNYDFDEKYMFSATVRADGSSNFSKDNRWGVFPSVSAGWIITNETFMESTSDWLNFFKLRASWGQNGNCNVEAFQYASMIKIGGEGRYHYADKDVVSTGAYPYKLANPDITWETSEQADFGFDARFLNSRLNVSFDLYKKTTKDWLVTAPTLAIYGADPCSINGGDVENKGFEFSLGWNDRRGDFSYGASVNMAKNTNEVVRIANTEGIIHGPENVLAQNTAELYRAEVGYAMGYFWGYKTAGVFQNQAEIDDWKAKYGEKAFIKGYEDTAPGDLKFVDNNLDGEITEDDKTEIGNPHPDFTLGFNIHLAWKGIDLSIDAYGAYGHQIAKCYREFSNTEHHNYTTDVLTKYWTGEGSTNRYPKFTHGKDANFAQISDIYLEDADYLKIRNITLGYDFKTLFKTLPVQKLRLYVTAQNLFTFTQYTGFDPEVGYGGGTSWASGIDIGYYPSPRTFMFGINVAF